MTREPAFRGASIVFLRQELRRRALEAPFLDALTPDERDAFHPIGASSWVPYRLVTRFFEVAAPLLHPGKVRAVRQLGRDIARAHLSGIYRVFLRFSTTKFLLEQTARLWDTYHSVGKAHVLGSEDARALHLIVVDYPEYTPGLRESLCGYIDGALELTGARDVVVAQRGSDPERWDFLITWK